MDKLNEHLWLEMYRFRGFRALEVLGFGRYGVHAAEGFRARRL